MTQKHALILMLLIVVCGLIATGVSQLQKDSSSIMKITPTPTPANLNFTQQETRTDPSKATAQLKAKKQYSTFPGTYPIEQLKDKVAVLETSKGQIVFQINPETPMASSNFIYLTQEGFYDGLIFHRVEPGFVIQGGDPLGNGTGGPGYKFPDEEVKFQYKKGVVAMANSGPNTNGSQFFIMLEDNSNLPPRYTIFGQVIKGQEVVDSIKVGDLIRSAKIQILSR